MVNCKRGPEFELRGTVKQIQVVARGELESWTARLRVRRAGHSATLPPLGGNAKRKYVKVDKTHF